MLMPLHIGWEPIKSPRGSSSQFSPDSTNMEESLSLALQSPMEGLQARQSIAEDNSISDDISLNSGTSYYVKRSYDRNHYFQAKALA